MDHDFPTVRPDLSDTLVYPDSLKRHAGSKDWFSDWMLAAEGFSGG
jgi:hypothetical protein